MRIAKFQQRITRFKYKNGKLGAAYITIPKKALEELNATRNRKFLIFIRELDKNTPEDTQEYQCKVCQYIFCMNGEKDSLYCPSCQNEDPNSIQEINTERGLLENGQD